MLNGVERHHERLYDMSGKVLHYNFLNSSRAVVDVEPSSPSELPSGTRRIELTIRREEGQWKVDLTQTDFSGF